MPSDYEIRRLQREIDNCDKYLRGSRSKEFLIWFVGGLVTLSLIVFVINPMGERYVFQWLDLVTVVGGALIMAVLEFYSLRWLYRRIKRRYERELAEEMGELERG